MIWEMMATIKGELHLSDWFFNISFNDYKDDLINKKNPSDISQPKLT